MMGLSCYASHCCGLWTLQLRRTIDYFSLVSTGVREMDGSIIQNKRDKIKFKNYFYVYACLFVCVLQSVSDHLELELQMLVSYLMWVLVGELGSSRRVATTLNF